MHGEASIATSNVSIPLRSGPTTSSSGSATERHAKRNSQSNLADGGLPPWNASSGCQGGLETLAVLSNEFEPIDAFFNDFPEVNISTSAAEQFLWGIDPSYGSQFSVCEQSL